MRRETKASVNLPSQRRPDPASDNATRGRLWTGGFASAPVR